jgi:acyl carrier protein
MYGPTETTIWSTTGLRRGASRGGGIGRPIANTQVYVLTRRCSPVGIGVPGELWIGGDGVTRGYWRPELTAERFRGGSVRAATARAFTAPATSPDGCPAATLDFLGRADFQVKLRGYRIELGEIETAIDALDGVRQSVVVVREDVPGTQLLVAYLLADTAVTEAALKTALADVLPAHMIPGRFVTLDAFPLTPNKKVDRKALPPPSAPVRAVADTPAAKTQAAPEAASAEAGFDGDVEAEISAIWAATLGVANITARDNFFDLGGHSLLAVQAHREIKSRLGVPKLSITDIFRFPVLGDLAEAVQAKLGAPARVTKPVPAPAASAPAPVANTGTEPEAPPATSRADAMARRREMRARRRHGS